MKLKSFYIFILLLLLSSCKQDDPQYLHHEVLPVQQRDDREYPLTLLEIDKNIDVLLVIDNSGSMGTIQRNVIDNSKLFFSKFAKQPFVNWKVGLISTDHTDDPYVGFDSSLDYTQVNSSDPGSLDKVVERFQTAVSRLGVNGSASEYSFFNVKRVLDLYDGVNRSPRFLRDRSHLVVIMITDEEEQSKRAPGVSNPSFYEPANFFNAITRYISSSNILRFYGAFNHKELKDCDRFGSYWTGPWRGNPFDELIRISSGFFISACTDNFGNDLARIGEDIVTLIGLPSLLLRRRPIVETLRVYYEGELLPPGRPADGGYWFYEEETNTINFYSMDFVKDFENDHLEIDFDIDDGIRRRK